MILAVPMIVTAQKIEDVKPGMTKEDVLEIAGKPLNIIFIGIDKSTADSLFSYEYNEKHFIYFLGNKVEGIDLDVEKTKLQVDSLINRKDQE
ncbi:MAG: outer membrane protein assembly factor BamE [Bacteroidetes bacterium]|nr:outer membrane protein assembly factor BamE [Bacteroidota bacterium]